MNLLKFLSRLRPQSGRGRHGDSPAAHASPESLLGSLLGMASVSYTHLTLPTNREV